MHFFRRSLLAATAALFSFAALAEKSGSDPIRIVAPISTGTVPEMMARSITDNAGGQVNIVMTAVPTAPPLVAAGKVKAMATTVSRRSTRMPDVPTLAEAGISDPEITSRQAIVAAAAIREAAVARLTVAVNKIIATSEYGEFLESHDTEREALPLYGYVKPGPKELRMLGEMVKISGTRFDCCRT